MEQCHCYTVGGGRMGWFGSPVILVLMKTRSLLLAPPTPDARAFSARCAFARYHHATRTQRRFTRARHARCRL